MLKLESKNFHIIVNLSKHLIYIAYLIVFCMVGVLIRIFLSDHLYKPSINIKSPNHSIHTMDKSSANGNIVYSIGDLFFSDLYANIVGCFVMGMLMAIHVHFLKKPLEELKEKEQEIMKKFENNSNTDGIRSIDGGGIGGETANNANDESNSRMVKLFLHRVFHGTLSFEKRIYTGLSTGMCGCITTFSRWQVSAAISLMKGDILSFVSKEVVGFSTCYFTFVIAKDITNAILTVVIPVFRKKFGKNSQQQSIISQNSIDSMESSSRVDVPELGVVESTEGKILLEVNEMNYGNNGELYKRKLVEEFQQIRNTHWKTRTAIKMGIDIFVVLMSLISLIIVLIGALNVSSAFDQRLSLTLLVAPLGCLLRYFICKLNVSLKAVERFQMPIFTLSINIFGSLVLVIIEGTAFVLGLNSGISLLWIDAFSIGFCGSLTTVSTFIQEIYGLNNTFKKYLYALSSIFWTTVIVSTCLILFMWIL